MDTFDFYIEPVVNPDGYIHTWDEVSIYYAVNVITDMDNLSTGAFVA
jgi:murein tripeptide amidase MpaA